MDYKQAVEKHISGETEDELKRRKELWKKIYTAYEAGVEDRIKLFLTEVANELDNKFKILLGQLRDSL
jgi:hypothetical protein